MKTYYHIIENGIEYFGGASLTEARKHIQLFYSNGIIKEVYYNE